MPPADGTLPLEERLAGGEGGVNVLYHQRQAVKLRELHCGVHQDIHSVLQPAPRFLFEAGGETAETRAPDYGPDLGQKRPCEDILLYQVEITMTAAVHTHPLNLPFDPHRQREGFIHRLPHLGE